MSEYTSTREGFQRAMEWSLTGPPEKAEEYADALSMPDFYQIVNGKRLDRDAHVQSLKEWRGKVSEYKPAVYVSDHHRRCAACFTDQNHRQEFLRDGDLLSARMTGTVKVGDVTTEFEAFMFAKVDKESGRLVHLIERAVYGPVGQPPEHGA